MENPGFVLQARKVLPSLHWKSYSLASMWGIYSTLTICLVLPLIFILGGGPTLYINECFTSAFEQHKWSTKASFLHPPLCPLRVLMLSRGIYSKCASSRINCKLEWRGLACNANMISLSLVTHPNTALLCRWERGVCVCSRKDMFLAYCAYSLCSVCGSNSLRSVSQLSSVQF